MLEASAYPCSADRLEITKTLLEKFIPFLKLKDQNLLLFDVQTTYEVLRCSCQFSLAFRVQSCIAKLPACVLHCHLLKTFSF